MSGGRPCRTGSVPGVVYLDEPVDAGSPELVGERVDGLDEPAGDISAASRLGDRPAQV
jgi:hypothetical protein